MNGCPALSDDPMQRFLKIRNYFLNKHILLQM